MPEYNFQKTKDAIVALIDSHKQSGSFSIFNSFGVGLFSFHGKQGQLRREALRVVVGDAVDGSDLMYQVANFVIQQSKDSSFSGSTLMRGVMMVLIDEFDRVHVHSPSAVNSRLSSLCPGAALSNNDGNWRLEKITKIAEQVKPTTEMAPISSV